MTRRVGRKTEHARGARGKARWHLRGKTDNTRDAERGTTRCAAEQTTHENAKGGVTIRTAQNARKRGTKCGKARTEHRTQGKRKGGTTTQVAETRRRRETRARKQRQEARAIEVLETKKAANVGSKTATED